MLLSALSKAVHWKLTRPFVRIALSTAALFFATLAATPIPASGQTVKLAFFNIQSGRGEPGLPGRPVLFTDNLNCIDPTIPMNAWGVGFIQQHLRQSIQNDPAVIVLGLAEAWSCGSPERVRSFLGWKSASTERNGLGMVAKYGFSGPEEWLQLDISLNPNPRDTMWVLRQAVCADVACAATVNVFAAHWYAPGEDPDQNASYDRQAIQTADFLTRAGGTTPHALIGDLNVFDGTAVVCGQTPNNIGLQRLRDAGYVDVWKRFYPTDPGFTGMTNRVGCGVPEGATWKRPDYAWSAPSYAPLSMQRFAMVPPGDAAPSDHYGIIAEFPMPAPGPAPGPSPAPAPPPLPPAPVEPPALPPPSNALIPPPSVVLYARDATAVAGAWQRVNDGTAAGAVRMWNPDRGAAKLTAPAPAPADYFELTFTAEAMRPYRLWARGRAERDDWRNDSMFVQFSGSVTAQGLPAFRIGSTDATVVSIEECSGCGLSGWGWQDNAYGSDAPPLYFERSGTQTIRVQRREDGVSIDQIVLAADVTARPGAARSDSTIVAATAAPAPSASPTEVVIGAARPVAAVGTWRVVPDPTAANGVAVTDPDAGAPKAAAATATPASYVEYAFTAEAGRAYRLWLRGRAERDFWGNDSVFVQFSGATLLDGSRTARIGTSAAFVVNLEEASGAGLSGWGWQDNGYGTNVLGPLVMFETSGPQTIRIQTREDGLRIDQIVLSSGTYLTTAPGRTQNDTTVIR